MDNQPTPNPNNTKRRRKKKNRKNRNNRPVALQQNDASAESLHEEHTSESSESAEITSQIKLTDGLISEPSATTLAPNTAQTLVHTQAGVAVTTSSFLPEPFPPPSPPPSPPTKPRRRSTFAPSPSASSYPSLSPLSFSSQASLPVEVIIKMIQFFHPIELSGLAATCISFYLAVRHVVSERKLSEKILPTSFVNVIYLVKNAEFFPLKNFLLRFFNHPWLSMPIRNWELKQFYQICKLNPIHVRAEGVYPEVYENLMDFLFRWILTEDSPFFQEYLFSNLVSFLEMGATLSIDLLKHIVISSNPFPPLVNLFLLRNPDPQTGKSMRLFSDDGIPKKYRIPDCSWSPLTWIVWFRLEKYHKISRFRPKIPESEFSSELLNSIGYLVRWPVVDAQAIFQATALAMRLGAPVSLLKALLSGPKTKEALTLHRPDFEEYILEQKFFEIEMEKEENYFFLKNGRKMRKDELDKKSGEIWFYRVESGYLKRNFDKKASETPLGTNLLHLAIQYACPLEIHALILNLDFSLLYQTCYLKFSDGFYRMNPLHLLCYFMPSFEEPSTYLEDAIRFYVDQLKIFQEKIDFIDFSLTPNNTNSNWNINSLVNVTSNFRLRNDLNTVPANGDHVLHLCYYVSTISPLHAEQAKRCISTLLALGADPNIENMFGIASTNFLMFDFSDILQPYIFTPRTISPSRTNSSKPPTSTSDNFQTTSTYAPPSLSSSSSTSTSAPLASTPKTTPSATPTASPRASPRTTPKVSPRASPRSTPTPSPRKTPKGKRHSKNLTKSAKANATNNSTSPFSASSSSSSASTSNSASSSASSSATSTPSDFEWPDDMLTSLTAESDKLQIFSNILEFQDPVILREFHLSELMMLGEKEAEKQKMMKIIEEETEDKASTPLPSSSSTSTPSTPSPSSTSAPSSAQSPLPSSSSKSTSPSPSPSLSPSPSSSSSSSSTNTSDTADDLGDSTWDSLSLSMQSALAVYDGIPELPENTEFRVEYQSETQANLIHERVNKLISCKLLPPYSSYVDFPQTRSIIFLLESMDHVKIYQKRKPVLCHD